MAQASKRRPWIVELKPPNLDNWYPMDAYASEDEARAQAELARRRIGDPQAEIRYRNFIPGSRYWTIPV